LIRSRSEMKRSEKIEIDLSGPQGNAFALLAAARTLGRKLGYSERKIVAIQKVMRLTNYEGLVHTFDQEFGDFVTLWR
jgi:hypothetical protein